MSQNTSDNNRSNRTYIEMLIAEAEQGGRHDANISRQLKQLIDPATILIEVEAGVVQSVYANRDDVTVNVHDVDDASDEETAAHEKDVVGLVEVY